MLTRRIALVAAAVTATDLISATRNARSEGTSAANSALLDRYAAAFNAHDLAGFRDVIAENYIQHNGRAGQGLAGLQVTLGGYFQTFPDFHMQVEDRVRENRRAGDIYGNAEPSRATRT
jgi:hypothetical protein